MCPLRIILIFLSATLAGFFVLRNLNSTQSDPSVSVSNSSDHSNSNSNSNSSAKIPPEKQSHKVYGAFVNGFWMCVDMASGRYLWRNLVSVSKKAD